MSRIRADHFPLATPDLIHQAEFALEVAARVLPLYETIFNIEYPLPKLDTLAVFVSLRVE
jgi:aminopeptidase N